MKIVCSGGWRTGSTMAFRAARAILWADVGEHAAGLCATGEEVRAKLHEGGHAVLKCHVYYPIGSEPRHTILHTVRNELDVVASLVRMKRYSIEQAAGEVLRQRAMHALLTNPDLSHLLDVVILRYEDAYRDRKGTVQHLARSLGVGLQPDQRDRIAYSLSPEVTKQHTDTLETQDEDLLQPGHIGEHHGEPGAWRKQLDAQQVRQVMEMLA